MLYQHPQPHYQELGYIRQELNRVHHITLSLEAREKELCMMLQIPASNNVYQQLELSRDEYYNLVNASKAQQGTDQGLKTDRLEKVILKQAAAIQDLENLVSYERKERLLAMEALEAEFCKKNVPDNSRLATGKETAKSSVTAKQVSKPAAPKQLTSRRQRSLDAFDYSDWQSWTDVLKSVYPKLKFSSMAHSSFFTSFRSNVLGPSVSGPLLPPHLFQRFITEFSFNFRSEIHEEYFDDSESSSFEKSEAILWKDILRQQNINLKFDHSTEKRIRAGLVNFITTNATPRHLPSGNSSRQYFIPKELSTKFTNWFQDHVITGFKEFDLKRKTSNLTDTVKTKKIKSSGDEIPHRVLDLEVEVDNLDLELVPADEYAWCLTFRLVSIDDEKSKMIMMWLLVRMKGKFPACKIRDGRGFGIPKELSE